MGRGGRPRGGAIEVVKLASLKGGRDGRLVVVSHDLTRAAPVPEVAPTLQAALDDWQRHGPALERASADLDANVTLAAFDFDPRHCAAPLPRAYQWATAAPTSIMWSSCARPAARKCRKAFGPIP